MEEKNKSIDDIISTEESLAKQRKRDKMKEVVDNSMDMIVV